VLRGCARRSGGEVRARDSGGSGVSVGGVAAGGGRQPGPQARQPVEGGPPVAAAVPPEDGPVKVALETLPSQAVVHAHGPALQTVKHPVGPFQGLMGPAGADTFRF